MEDPCAFLSRCEGVQHEEITEDTRELICTTAINKYVGEGRGYKLPSIKTKGMESCCLFPHCFHTIQGVVITDPSNNKSRIEVTIKPDMTFTAAHSDIWGALGLNCFGGEGAGGEGDDEGKSVSSKSSGRGAGGEGGGGSKGGAGLKDLNKLKLPSEDAPAEGADRGERQRGQFTSDSGPDIVSFFPLSGAGGGFVERWVRTLSSSGTQPKDVPEANGGRKVSQRFEFVYAKCGSATANPDKMMHNNHISLHHTHTSNLYFTLIPHSQ